MWCNTVHGSSCRNQRGSFGQTSDRTCPGVDRLSTGCVSHPGRHRTTKESVPSMGCAGSGRAVRRRTDASFRGASVSRGPRRPSDALSDNGGGPLQEHEAGAGRSQARIWHGLSVQAAQREPAGQTGPGVSWSQESDLRTWLFLASTQRLSVRHLTENTRRLLGREVRCERSPRQTNQQGTEESRMVRAHSVAVPAQSAQKIGEETR